MSAKLPHINAAISARLRAKPQDEAATVLGVSQSTISRWVNGEQSPGKEFWPALEQYLKLPKGHLTPWGLASAGTTAANGRTTVLTHDGLVPVEQVFPTMRLASQESVDDLHKRLVATEALVEVLATELERLTGHALRPGAAKRPARGTRTGRSSS